MVMTAVVVKPTCLWHIQVDHSAFVLAVKSAGPDSSTCSTSYLSLFGIMSVLKGNLDLGRRGGTAIFKAVHKVHQSW